jgi:hypothetical protein
MVSEERLDDLIVWLEEEITQGSYPQEELRDILALLTEPPSPWIEVSTETMPQVKGRGVFAWSESQTDCSEHSESCSLRFYPGVHWMPVPPLPQFIERL